MAGFAFEGELEDITPSQLEFIKSVLDKRGYKTGNVLVEYACKVGDNYGATVKRITVKGDDGSIFKMFAKMTDKSESSKTAVRSAMLFFNENLMYTEILKRFTELETKANIPECERFRYAACYGSIPQPQNEILLLEDLAVSNYVMLDKFQTLTDDNIKLILKDLAILHSLSYALKAQELETYNHFRDKLTNPWTTPEQIKELDGFFVQLENDLVSLMDGEKYKKAVKGAFRAMLEAMEKADKIERESKYSVILQGDAWTNNMMFKLEDGKSVDCCMIDYQLSREGSPIVDINNLIFNCTDYETRSNHYHQWIEYYHSQLEKSLAKFGLNANLVYPRHQLNIDMERYTAITFASSLIFYTMTMREKTDAENMKLFVKGEGDLDQRVNTSRLSSLNAKTISICKSKIIELVDSFHDLGLFISVIE